MIALSNAEYIIQQGRHKGWTDIHTEPNKEDAIETLRLLRIEAIDIKFKLKYQIVERITTEKIIKE